MREEISRRKLKEEPLCGLTMQWSQNQHGKFISRYSGDDGRIYELIAGDGWYVLDPGSSRQTVIGQATSLIVASVV